MTLSDIGIVCGLCTSLLGAGAVGGDYYLQHEYVPIASMIQRDIRELKAEIRDLEYDRDHGGLTDKQEWLYNQLLDDLGDLQDQLN